MEQPTNTGHPISDTRRPRVLVVSDFYLPHWTGIVKAFTNITRSLTGEIEFRVLTVQFKPELPEEEIVAGVTILRCPPLLKISRASYSLGVVFRSIREIARSDAVVINSPCTNVLPCTLIARLLGKRVTIFHQGDLKLREGLGNRIIETLFALCTKAAMALANTVATYTTDYAENSPILRPFLHKLQPVIPPVYPPALPSPLPAAGLRLQELRRKGRTVIGLAGRFSHEKGFDLLFKALPQIIAEFPEVTFAFAGATDLGYEDFFTEIRSTYEPIAEHIEFLGLLPEQEIGAFYHLIDAVVIPSRSDCFNLVQAEALLCGKPTLSSDIPGLRHLVRESGFGVLCKPEDPQAIVDGFRTLMQNRNQISARHQALLSLLELTACKENTRTFLLGER